MIGRLRFWFDHRWTPDHLSEYVDGDLDSMDTDRVERHVHDCPKCREILRSLRAILSSLGGMRETLAEKPTIAPAVMAGVRGELRGSEGDEPDA